MLRLPVKFHYARKRGGQESRGHSQAEPGDEIQQGENQLWGS
jgi:hypothetical protein